MTFQPLENEDLVGNTQTNWLPEILLSPFILYHEPGPLVLFCCNSKTHRGHTPLLSQATSSTPFHLNTLYSLLFQHDIEGIWWRSSDKAKVVQASVRAGNRTPFFWFQSQGSFLLVYSTAHTSGFFPSLPTICIFHIFLLYKHPLSHYSINFSLLYRY